jgi:hypothetical protein
VRLFFVKTRRVASLAVLAALCSTAAWAQSGTASIGGRVTDQQGAAVPGASVTVTNLTTAAARSTVTNQAGLYQFTALPPGLYDMAVALAGFRPVKYEKLELRVDIQARQDVELTVGTAESVTVQAESPLINTHDASLGNTMSEQAIRTLPVEARNVVHLLSLQPGAVYIPRTNPDSVDPRYGSVSGARADQGNVTLDGIDVNDPQLQSAYTSAVRVTQDALQEFRVSTSNYGADQGRSSGPQVSLVTKSGTNTFHGSGYFFGRRTKTSSNEYFNKLTQLSSNQPNQAPKLDKDIYGGALGGPIKRNRIFFFANFERLTEESELPQLRSVPSASFRDGVLLYRCRTAAECPGGTARGFTGTHTVPAGFYGLSPAEAAAIDPLGVGPSAAAAQLFKQYPLPNEPGTSYRGNIDQFRFAAPIPKKFVTYVGRLDFKLNESGSQNLFLRVNAQDDTIDAAPQFPGQPPASQTFFKNLGLAVGYDWAVSSNLMNTFRYGMTRIDTETRGRTSANYVTFRFLSDFEPISFTSTRETPTHNFIDEVSWLRGTHTFKLGANVRLTRIPSTRNSGSFLSATVNPSWVSGIGRRYMPGNAAFCRSPGCSAVPAADPGAAAAYADPWITILGIVTQSTLRANYLKDGSQLPVGAAVEREYATDEYEVYLQDSWRIWPSLTVTAGVRYGLFSPPYEVNGLQVAPSISMGEWFAERERNMKAGRASNQSPIVTFDLAGKKNGRRGFYETDKNNIAPRFSFAWTPHADSGLLGWLTGGDRMVIRGGYSKVYDRHGSGIALNFDSAFAFGMATTINSPFGRANEDTAGVRFVDLKTLPPTVPAAPRGGFPQTPPRGAGVITSSIDDTLVTPSAHMANLVIGRELGNSFSIEAGYVGRFGRDLLVRRDIAMPLDLVDTRSGMGYYEAAQLMLRNAQNAGVSGSSPSSAFAALPAIPYWENLFPAAAAGGLTATQVMTQSFLDNAPDYITALWLADQFCEPACSRFGEFAYFAEQYDALAALSSIGRANYNSLQATLRKRYTRGYQFDLNYTLSWSKDHASQVERGGAFGNFGNGGYTGFLLDSWNLEKHWGTSDFDVRHQVNLNWIADLPFGKGRRFGSGSSGFLNQLIGDWSVAGLLRWTSGFPFNVINCRSCWPTNWNLQGNAELKDPGRGLPATGTTKGAVDGRPSPFKDVKEALGFFRTAYPGEVGLRNQLRGDGYFNIDMSLSKAFPLGFRDHKLRLRLDVFNVTNTAKFDVGNVTMTPDASGFGRYNGTLATCDALAGRCMQFAVRYEF